MSTSVEIVNDKREEAIKAMREAVLAALTAVGGHIEGEAKEELQNAPKRVDTGLLRNSITYALSGQAPKLKMYRADKTTAGDKAGDLVEGNVRIGFYTGTAPDDPEDAPAVYIGTNVEYALYVHEGTERMKANRFLKNAIERNKAQVMGWLEKALKS